jgi:hypothetical protein
MRPVILARARTPTQYHLPSRIRRALQTSCAHANVRASVRTQAIEASRQMLRYEADLKLATVVQFHTSFNIINNYRAIQRVTHTHGENAVLNNARTNQTPTKPLTTYNTSRIFRSSVSQLQADLHASRHTSCSLATGRPAHQILPLPLLAYALQLVPYYVTVELRLPLSSHMSGT